MAKRANPHRRLLARQMALRRTLVTAGNAEDAGKLQEGRVRSSADGRMRVSRKGDVSGALTSNRPMRPLAWEGRGVAGKVVKGNLKRVKPGTKSRHSGQPKGPLPDPALDALAVHPTSADSLRAHGLRSQKLRKFRFED